MRVRAVVILSLFALGCHSAATAESVDSEEAEVTEVTEQQEEQRDIDAFRIRVKGLYEPARCFRTNFAVTLTVPGQGSQTASGLLRADNDNGRMRMILTEPNLGLTLSWITIKDNMAYVSNPRYAGVHRIPLQGFELQSLGTNNIRLPFSLFKDILYGGLPPKIYEEDATWEKTEDGVRARYTDNGDVFEYTFGENYRVKRILYNKAGGGYHADIVFTGVFANTIFPQWFAIQTYAGGRPSETMRVVFQAANFNAWCKDHYFPVQ